MVLLLRSARVRHSDLQNRQELSAASATQCPICSQSSAASLTGHKIAFHQADQCRGHGLSLSECHQRCQTSGVKDIEWTRRQLAHDKVLSVSVVGSMQEGWGIEQLAADYAQCAKWAVESGADCVETNFSCPNVNTCDGQLYLDIEKSAIVSEAVKSEIGQTPLIIKVGHFAEHEMIPQFLSAVARHTDAVSMTNSIASRVGVSDCELMFDSQQRGICGRAILDASLRQVAAFAQAIEESGAELEVIGLGGIETATDVCRYLKAGANVCHLATHPMVEPWLRIRNPGQPA